MAADEKWQIPPDWKRYLSGLLVTIAVGGYVVAILFGLTADRRLDGNSIILIVLAAGFVYLTINPSAIEGLSSITFGSFKAEFAQLRAAQELQQRQVESMSAVLALLLTEQQQAQLLKMRRDEAAQYQGNHELRTLLRKLRDMRLLQMKTDSEGRNLTIAAMEDGKVVDLRDSLFLTPLGTRIADQVARIETDKEATMQRRRQS